MEGSHVTKEFPKKEAGLEWGELVDRALVLELGIPPQAAGVSHWVILTSQCRLGKGKEMKNGSEASLMSHRPGL